MTSVASQNLQDDVAQKTKSHHVDTLAAMISGFRLKASKLATGFIATQGGTHEATVWGTDIWTTAINAALVAVSWLHGRRPTFGYLKITVPSAASAMP
jgi:2-methylcitrate dehydratase PrpD